MNFKLMTGPELNNRLIETIGQTKDVRMAVAFWGRGACESLGVQAGAKIVCNLTSGGTNPYEIQKLIDMRANVRQHNSIHAKIGCIGTSVSFVGSSNMSANGLGDEAKAASGWEESNVVFDGIEPSVLKRFEELWSASHDITNDCLTKAKEAWQKRQQANQANQDKPDGTFVEVLKRIPDHFTGQNTHVVVYKTNTAEENKVLEVGTEAAVAKYGSDFDVYSDWAELPKDGMLLNFRILPSETIAYEGIFKRHSDHGDIVESGQVFQAARKVEDKVGIGKVRVTNKDQKTLEEAVLKYIKNNEPVEGGTYCFPISELIV